jgi:hypothetical protein
MTKIILNLIFFSLLVQKLQNDHPTHCLIKGFSTIPKNATRAPWFERVKVWSQNKTNTHVHIYIYINNPTNGIIFKALRVRTCAGRLSEWAC